MLTLNAYPNISVDGAPLHDLVIETLGSGHKASAQAKADAYEKTVVGLFGEIGKTSTGGAVLKLIVQQVHHTMTVIPQVNVSLETPPCASTTPDNPEDARRRGRGTSTTIRFTPAHRSGSRPNRHDFHECCSRPGTDPDEVLLHEVFHGLRQMSGMETRRKVLFRKKSDSFEDFYAILVTNIYRSEKKRHGLRADHWSFESLHDKRIDNVDVWLFHKLNRAHLRKLRRQMPNLWEDLKGVKADFNPIALA